MLRRFVAIGPWIVLATVIGWAFAPTLRELFRRWMTDAQYSHGILVPAFSLFLVMRRKKELLELPTGSAWFTASILLLAAFAMRIAGALLDFVPADGGALIATFAASTALWKGRPGLALLSPALAFLFFMLPLPYQVERWLGADLQRLATLGSTFALQTIGQPAINEGNVILIQEVKLGVVEACSGLRMLLAFAAFATGMALLLDRDRVTKGILLASAVPIALVVNILRITATGMAYVLLRESPDRGPMLEFLHDFNGWLMMPMALALLLAEVKLLGWLLAPPARHEATVSFPMPMPVERRRAA